MRDGLLLLVVIFALVATLRYPFVGILTWAWFSLMTPHQLAYGTYGLPLNVLIAGATIFSLVASGSFARRSGCSSRCASPGSTPTSSTTSP